jgi:pyruvate/2-oxoglutarate dehydrogenase complex dihydrolipoamide acyltransferase (E2) component
MRLRRAAAGAALVALVVMTGCSGDSGGGGGSAGEDTQAAPAADAAATEQDRSAQASAGAASDAAPNDAAGKAGSANAASQIRLQDLGNRIIRTATIDLEVSEGKLNATDIVRKAKGIYVGSSTSVPSGEPASGQVTFRVPVDAFESVLRELKGLGTYRGEQSSTDDVTNQYIDRARPDRVP